MLIISALFTGIVSLMQKSITELKLDLKKIHELHQSGALGDDSCMDAVAKVEREILRVVVNSEDLPHPAPVAAATALTDAQIGSKPKVGAIAFYGLTIFAIVTAAVGYYWKAGPRLESQQTETRAEGTSNLDAKPGEPHSEGSQLEKMARSLAAKLKEAPDNVDGWVMLSRTYVVMGKNPEALSAMENAYSLQKGNPEIMAALAEVKAINNSNSYDGDPIKLIEQALAKDPHCRLALYLAGDYAFEKKSYAKAVKMLEEFASTGPQDSARTKKAWITADQARVAAGMPAKPRTAITSVESTPTTSFKLPEENAASSKDSSKVIGGVVTISPALVLKASPDDTLYVFARDANGSRMPLAIVSRKVKDLPFSFSLDDSTSMAPTSKLSAAKKVIVGARISKSGNPIPQPGDLSGLSKESELGKSDLKIEISEIIK